MRSQIHWVDDRNNRESTLWKVLYGPIASLYGMLQTGDPSYKVYEAFIITKPIYELIGITKVRVSK